jgi:MFS transporter, PAT family, beta-lactamase induction signal transducer AmpG
MSEPSATTSHARPPRPFLYFLLFLPFGATAGFLMVTVGALAKKTGMSDAAITGMVAINTLPHTWKFLWAPVVDTLWTGRGWYITTNLISSGCIIALGFIPIRPDTVTLMTVIIFINGLATTFIGMCTEALMAKLTPPEQRGLAGGWSQAGNLGGATIGGFGLILANELAYDWMPFVIVGGLLLSCSIVLGFIKEPKRDPSLRFRDNMRALGRDLWGLLVDDKRANKLPTKWLALFPPIFFYILSGAGILSITLSLMTIGSGGALNVFPLMGAEWGASDGLVSFSNGLVTGGAAIIGSLLGGLLATKIDKRWAYAVSGIVLALFAFGMALLPKTPEIYVAGCLFYSVGLGMCYATFTAFVLDIIGHTGGATKYNLFASLANMPIYTMALVDGYVATAHGRTEMLWVDGLSGIGGAILLMGIVFILRKRRLVPPPAP